MSSIRRANIYVLGTFLLNFGRSKLMIMPRALLGKINAKWYVETLELELQPILESAQSDTFMFQQDNPPIYTSYISRG